MEMTIQAVFWDSDNTLVDTNALHWGKHVHTLKNYGIELKDEHRQRIYHNNGQQNWTWLNQELGLEIDRDIYLAEIDAWYKAHTPSIQIRSGIIEALEMFKDASIPQAVVSNGRKNSVMMALEPKDLTKYFIHIATKEDSCERKPHPGPYIDAKKIVEAKLGVSLDSATCLAIEDDPKGVMSADTAGFITIHRKLSEDQVDSPHAHKSVFEENQFLEILKEYTQ